MSTEIQNPTATSTAALPRRMLRMLREGGIASTADLARRLIVSEELIGMMAEEMTRRGYLARLSGCHGGCGGCHAASSCAASPSGTTSEATSSVLLLLTPKGRQAAASE